jgi:hypothetical protein
MKELAKDVDPASRDAASKVYEDWKGAESEEELKRILAKRRRQGWRVIANRRAGPVVKT